MNESETTNQTDSVVRAVLPEDVWSEFDPE